MNIFEVVDLVTILYVVHHNVSNISHYIIIQLLHLFSSPIETTKVVLKKELNTQSDQLKSVYLQHVNPIQEIE